MNPNEIELNTMSKSFEYEKISRDIDSIEDLDTLKDVAKSYLKLYFKQQEVITKL